MMPIVFCAKRRLRDVGSADVRQQRDRVLNALAALRAQVAEAHDVVVHRLHVVQRHRLAGVLEQVEDVVHRVDQAVDLLAVDRRDEGLVEQPLTSAVTLSACRSAWPTSLACLSRSSTSG